ncbi:MAG: phosphoribosylformylglycinamidine synthase [Deltaproteobacteria bacterium]|nr:phosphoribosylformylglycinamidine synthase [Deltaproteobacteria bacterium]
MTQRLEIALQPGLFDAEGAAVKAQARDYFGIAVESVRVVHIITIDAPLDSRQREEVRSLFTNPVSQQSSFDSLPLEFDWAIWVGYRPGVRDTAGSTAAEAIEDFLKKRFADGEACYTSTLYCLSGKALTRDQVSLIARESLANELVQQWEIFDRSQHELREAAGVRVPKVVLQHTPAVTTIPISSDEALLAVSDERNLALNPRDIPTIREYFLRPAVREERLQRGLDLPTDVELEYIAQARSDHCSHNTFRGLFRYQDLASGHEEIVDNLFKTCIQEPTLEIQRKKPWVVSVLWDNAGVGRFDDRHYYTITGETHNSPSNMEAYGGALTGIVGVYRDPIGTGLGSKLIFGMYGFCVGPRDYRGELKPHLHPRRLLDGVITGVKDGGNKSGIPTPFGNLFFHESYLGKCLVFVTAVGIMPARVGDRPTETKATTKGDLIVMTGGRVGKDGIHGVTASSEVFSESTPAGHVQIGDPYTQKKMHDFLMEARDEGLIAFITDNGGGGLSSSIGESSLISNGCEVHLDRVPLKYAGLDPWEIWISESQERMTVAIKPEHEERFMEMSRKHDVESTVIGTYTDSGKIHILFDGKDCASVNTDLLRSDFPQWEFDAVWISPEMRGLTEPFLREPEDHASLLRDLLARPNIASKEWIVRQYDHEVQGGSVIKPLVGKERDIPSDAAVVRPVLTSLRGLAATQAVNPSYSEIDTYHMTASTIDEAVRRLVAVGVGLDDIAGVDNFCWPSIQYDPVSNPDGRYKAAQLVRANWALRDCCLAYGIPLLSGKDSMYIDGNLKGRYGETHRISGLPTLQFTATGMVEDVRRCVTLDAKVPGDLVYLMGVTRNELGGSEYYDRFGYVGLNVPKVAPAEVIPWYRALHQALREELAASCHGIYRGGMGVHLAFVAMGGCVGLEIDLGLVPTDGVDTNDRILYSETVGRFIVTIAPANKARFETLCADVPHACIGEVIPAESLHIRGVEGRSIMEASIADLKHAWKKRFGALV